MLTNGTIWKFWYEDDPRKKPYIIIPQLYMMRCHITVLLEFHSLPLYHRSFWRVMEGVSVSCILQTAAGAQQVWKTWPDPTSMSQEPQTPWSRRPPKIETSIVGCWTCWTFFGEMEHPKFDPKWFTEILGKWNFCQSWSEWIICRVKYERISMKHSRNGGFVEENETSFSV